MQIVATIHKGFFVKTMSDGAVYRVTAAAKTRGGYRYICHKAESDPHSARVWNADIVFSRDSILNKQKTGEIFVFSPSDSDFAKYAKA